MKPGTKKILDSFNKGFNDLSGEMFSESEIIESSRYNHERTSTAIRKNMARMVNDILKLEGIDSEQLDLLSKMNAKILEESFESNQLYNDADEAQKKHNSNPLYEGGEKAKKIDNEYDLAVALSNLQQCSKDKLQEYGFDEKDTKKLLETKKKVKKGVNLCLEETKFNMSDFFNFYNEKLNTKVLDEIFEKEELPEELKEAIKNLATTMQEIDDTIKEAHGHYSTKQITSVLESKFERTNYAALTMEALSAMCVVAGALGVAGVIPIAGGVAVGGTIAASGIFLVRLAANEATPYTKYTSTHVIAKATHNKVMKDFRVKVGEAQHKVDSIKEDLFAEVERLAEFEGKNFAGQVDKSKSTNEVGR